MMAVITKVQQRPSKAQTLAAPSVQQHRGRMIGVIIFAVVILAAIVLLIVYGQQIAGKAIALVPTTLKTGEAGIPIGPQSSVKVGDAPQELTVYANLGGEDGYGFHFVMR